MEHNKGNLSTRSYLFLTRRPHSAGIRLQLLLIIITRGPRTGFRNAPKLHTPLTLCDTTLTHNPRLKLKTIIIQSTVFMGLSCDITPAKRDLKKSVIFVGRLLQQNKTPVTTTSSPCNLDRGTSESSYLLQEKKTNEPPTLQQIYSNRFLPRVELDVGHLRPEQKMAHHLIL